jgi:hypothetical protein
MGTVKRRWIESMEPTEEPPMERERLHAAASGYTAGISAGADSKPTLTDAEREAVEWCIFQQATTQRIAVALRGLLERLAT